MAGFLTLLLPRLYIYFTLSNDNNHIMNTTNERRALQANRQNVNNEDIFRDFPETKKIVHSYNIIWFFVNFINVLLGFRFVFELFGASTSNDITQLIYSVSNPFVDLFHSIFGITTVAHAYFDWSILLAMAFYILIGYGLVHLLRIRNPVSKDELRVTQWIYRTR